MAVYSFLLTAKGAKFKRKERGSFYTLFFVCLSIDFIFYRKEREGFYILCVLGVFLAYFAVMYLLIAKEKSSFAFV
jgi:hypothetical protein